MLDAIPCNTNENAENVDDLCFNYPKFILINGSVWDKNSYISTKTKYCYKYDYAEIWWGSWGHCRKRINGWFSYSFQSHNCQWRDSAGFGNVGCHEYGCANYNSGNGYAVSIACSEKGTTTWYK